MADQVQKVSNPFGEVQRQGANEQTSVQREVSEVQSQVIVAQQFPRDEKHALEEILNACTRSSLAESAVYQYSRGGSDISGPSIRLAEAIAQHWGNMTAGIREIEQGYEESTVEAYAWDLQTNTRISKRFHVPHKRYTKRGSYKLEDPRDIYEMIANQGARRLRACILSVIPGDVTEKAVQQCEETMRANENIDQESINKMLKAFKEYGIEKEQIEAFIQRRMDSITPALMSRLRKIYNSLKDGMSSPQDWFPNLQQQRGQPAEGQQSGVQGLKSQINGESGAKSAPNVEADQNHAEGSDNAQSAKSDGQDKAQGETLGVESEQVPQGNQPASQLTFNEACSNLDVSENQLKAFLKNRGNRGWKQTATEFKQRIIDEPEEVSKQIKEQEDNQ